MTIESSVGIETPRMPRALRLLLTFLGVLFGLLVLGFVFGSSSASADEGPDAGGTLVGAVDTIAHSAPAASITTPLVEQVAEVAPVLTPVAPVLEPVLEPVTTFVDTTVAAVGDSVVVPALDVIEGLAPAGRDVLAAVPAASWIPVTTFDVAGDAIGSLDLLLSSPLGTANMNASPSGAPPLATALAAGLIVLLIARRSPVPDGAVPASVVYDTDSSPD